MLNLRQQNITVARDDLLVALRRNLEVHKSEYLEAFEDYKKILKESLKKALQNAEANNFEKVDVQIAKPQNHEADYQRAIDMIEVSTNTEFTIDGDSYAAYFKNEWPWKRTFDVLAASYKSGIGA